MSRKKLSSADKSAREFALENLHQLVIPGVKVYVQKVYSNPRGGAARFSVMVPDGGSIRNITSFVARVTGVKLRRDGFLVATDMTNVLRIMSKELNYPLQDEDAYYIFNLYGL